MPDYTIDLAAERLKAIADEAANLRSLKKQAETLKRDALFNGEMDHLDERPIAAAHFLTAMAHLEAAAQQFALAAIHADKGS